ncbi:MAG: hypothetical protein AAGJ35_00450 [Myxococcota bacterium]
MKQIRTLSFEVEEWPTFTDVKEFLPLNDKQKMKEFLTEEFDSFVHMRADDLDLLSGYPEAFILPVHAFVRSLSRGLRDLAKHHQASVPIYLQQYAVVPGSQSHTLECKLDQGWVEINFSWGGEKEPPIFLKELPTLRVPATTLQQAVVECTAQYIQHMAEVLRRLPEWQVLDSKSLFEEF